MATTEPTTVRWPAGRRTTRASTRAALTRDLERRVEAGTARRVESARGGVAYIPD